MQINLLKKASGKKMKCNHSERESNGYCPHCETGTSNLRYVFGTRTKKWSAVNSSDRDFFQGIPFSEFRKLGKKGAREKYLGARLLR